MADVSDPLQESCEQIERSIPPDKKIIFGARKPTDEPVGWSGIPPIIEAPFPSERTLQWFPDSGPDKSDDDDGSIIEVEHSGDTAIIVSQEVLLKVNEHVSQTLDHELGGFLLGNRYRCPTSARDYVIIDQYSPAKFTEANEISLSLTHEAWAQLSDELSGKFLGKLLVGWYHSHPRMDVFLSSHDMEIQTQRFPEPWMMALVLEPEKHRGGFFISRAGRVKPNSPVEFYELLERNTRDSVLAWEGYRAVDPSTSSIPNLNANNTATNAATSSAEIKIARSQLGKRVTREPNRRRRWLLFAALVVIALGAGLGVVKRKQLRPWVERKLGRTPGPQSSVAPQSLPSQAATSKTHDIVEPKASPSPAPAPSPEQQSTSTGQAAASETPRGVQPKRRQGPNTNKKPRPKGSGPKANKT
ncbi:MAG TPA: hypothetical protein VI306_00670 [Pyrinomonadaceae bacterium]